jgi:pimeloyl-ACP methyl ester carboxylesterase
MRCEWSSSVDIHYEVEGSGPATFLLFNGASLPLEFWGPVAPALAQHGRVLRFDQRNAGTTRAPGTFTLNDVAADAARLLDLVEAERAVVVGHAWGGRAAQVFARDYPHRVRGLVICGTGGELPVAGNGEISARLVAARRAGDRPAWEAALTELYCAPGLPARDPATFASIAAVIWDNRPPRDVKADAKVSPSSSYWGTCRAPALLLYGRHDRFGTPENGADLHARLRDSRLVMIEEAGHFLVREQADRIVSEIVAFASALP